MPSLKNRCLTFTDRPLGDSSLWGNRAGFAIVMMVVNGAVASQMTMHGLSFEVLHELQPRDVQLWITANAMLISCYFLVCWRYASALSHLRQLIQQTSSFLDRPALPVPMNARAMLVEMATLSRLVKEQSSSRRELKRELETVRQVLTQCTVQQQAMLATTNREISMQYQSVLSYANYLDEHIQRKTADAQLRFDFDDVCESSFTLKLIAGALDLLRCQSTAVVSDVPLATLMQQTMLALAPSLDRRAMRLTTAEADESVVALTDAGILSHVLWMMLLGLVRYAADESTLRMRCLYDTDRKRVLLSIVVSELAPGAMSPQERAEHLMRQMDQGNPPMFAETIKLHGNIQLAELMLTRIDAQISVVPLSAYACEICLNLPAA